MILDKIKEVLSTVLPVTILVLILNYTIIPIGDEELIRFILGAILIIIGLAIFLLGVDIGITPIGETMGGEIIKSNKIIIVAIISLLLGFVISVAEPDLHILASQVEIVTNELVAKNVLVVTVSIGVAILVSIGMIRIVYSIPLNRVLIVVYFLIFGIAIFVDTLYLSVAFDASGSTTGALTVPFILALAAGASALNKDSKSSEIDSFGLVGIASAGAILGVLLLSIFSTTELSGVSASQVVEKVGIFKPFFDNIPHLALETLIALLPITIIYIVANKVFFKQSRRRTLRTYSGIFLAFIGLVLFLTGVNAGFMDVGRFIGETLGAKGNNLLIVFIAFLLGVLTILAEPAVHVLTNQIREVTAGYVKKSTVLFTLSIGVGISVALSVIKIVIPGLQLWHVLLPGYIIAFILSFKIPSLFVGIAFDSGGVASGPMTATFILAYAQGIASSTPTADLLNDGFGTIAMVAMTPLIALQLLGLLYKKDVDVEEEIDG